MAILERRLAFGEHWLYIKNCIDPEKSSRRNIGGIIRMDEMDDDDDDKGGDLRVHRPGRTSPVSSCIMPSDDTARTGAGNETIIAKEWVAE
jgi:hypothetical protein